MNSAKKSKSNDVLPSIAIVFGGVMWGLYWLPLRAVGRGRLDGRMAGHAGLCRALCPAVAVSHFSGSEISNHKLAGACLVWDCSREPPLHFIPSAVFLTDVIHSILLFYMTPVWSTVLGILFLGGNASVFSALSPWCSVSPDCSSYSGWVCKSHGRETSETGWL